MSPCPMKTGDVPFFTTFNYPLPHRTVFVQDKSGNLLSKLPIQAGWVYASQATITFSNLKLMLIPSIGLRTRKAAHLQCNLQRTWPNGSRCAPSVESNQWGHWWMRNSKILYQKPWNFSWTIGKAICELLVDNCVKKQVMSLYSGTIVSLQCPCVEFGFLISSKLLESLLLRALK